MPLATPAGGLDFRSPDGRGFCGFAGEVLGGAGFRDDVDFAPEGVAGRKKGVDERGIERIGASRWGGLDLEGEIAVEVDFGLFRLPPALDAGLLIGAPRPHIAKDAFAIELLFETAEGLVDRLPALEPDFNHEPQPYRKRVRRGRAFFPQGYRPQAAG